MSEPRAGARPRSSRPHRDRPCRRSRQAGRNGCRWRSSSALAGVVDHRRDGRDAEVPHRRQHPRDPAQRRRSSASSRSAMTPVTLSGNFVSLGISQSAMLAMVSFVALLGAGWPQLPAILIVVVGLVVVGVLQGAIVAAGLNPVITTLAAGAIIFGVVSELTGGGIVRGARQRGGLGRRQRRRQCRSRCSSSSLFTALVTLADVGAPCSAARRCWSAPTAPPPRSAASPSRA